MTTAISTELKHSESIGMVYTPVQLQARVVMIQKVIKDVMIKGVHYGTMPGMRADSKPVLLKPGSELLLSMFGVAIDPEVEDLSGDDEIRYRIKSVGKSIANGAYLGAGIGECSSSEDKYMWRAAVCDEEFDATDDQRRRIKWKAGWQGKPAYSINQVRTNPADVANTILKMAKKRANSDATLAILACSDCFEQEEMADPDYVAAQGDTSQEGQAATTQRKTASRKGASDSGGDVASDKQAGMIFAVYHKAGITDDEMKAHLKEKYNIESLKSSEGKVLLPKSAVNDLLAWIPEAAKAKEPKPGEANAEQMGFQK